MVKTIPRWHTVLYNGNMCRGDTQTGEKSPCKLKAAVGACRKCAAECKGNIPKHEAECRLTDTDTQPYTGINYHVRQRGAARCGRLPVKNCRRSLPCRAVSLPAGHESQKTQFFQDQIFVDCKTNHKYLWTAGHTQSRER